MPAKRKLSDGRGEEDSKSSVKKPKRTEMDDAELMQALYDTIRNHKTEDGHLLCEAFVRAPKRRTDPEYYNLVSRPIDLIKIQHKLKSDEYKSLEGFVRDVETLVENAKIYYRPDTQEYQDACDLWELFLESKTVLLGEELAEYDPDTGEDEEDEEDEEEEEPFTEDAEKSKEVIEVRAEVTNPSPEISSIVIPGTGSTPTIKLKMASSPPVGEIRDATSKMDTTQAAVEGGECVRKSHDDEGTPKEAEPIRSLRERRYTYRDFLFPKVVISEKQDQVAKQAIAEKEMEVDEDKPNVTCEEDDTSYEELFAAVVTAKDGERCISEMFKLLPSRKKYPDYYDVIQDPIDLRTIAQKIQGNEYKCLDEMIRDLNQMIHNAKSFNETGSQIYRDAVTLKKIVTNKKHELDQLRNSQHPVRSERIRTRKANAGQRLSLIIAAMDSDSDKEDNSEAQAQGDIEDLDSGTEASAAESEEDSLWILYRTVKSQKNSLNQRISEPFLRLPSRRVYPDYYEEIKKPMSLLKIQKKLKSCQYSDLDHLAADLELVFENAKHYNMDESKLYKDAVRLQGVMNTKLKELKAESPIQVLQVMDTADMLELSASDQSESCNHSEHKDETIEESLKRHQSNSDYILPGATNVDGATENCSSCTSMNKSVIDSSHSVNTEGPASVPEGSITSSSATPPLASGESTNAVTSMETDASTDDSVNKDDAPKKEESGTILPPAGFDSANSSNRECITATSSEMKEVTCAASTTQSLHVTTESTALNTYPHVNLTKQQLPLNNLQGLQLGIQRPAIGQLPFRVASIPLTQTGVRVGPVGNVQIPFPRLQTPFAHQGLPMIVGQVPLLRGQIGVPPGVRLPLHMPVLAPGTTVPPVLSEASNKSHDPTMVHDIISSKTATVTVAATETVSGSLVTVTGSESSFSATAGLGSSDSTSCTVPEGNSHLVSSTVKSVGSEAISVTMTAVTSTTSSKNAAESLNCIVSVTTSTPSSICAIHVDDSVSVNRNITQVSPSVASSHPASSNCLSSSVPASSSLSSSSSLLSSSKEIINCESEPTVCLQSSYSVTAAGTSIDSSSIQSVVTENSDNILPSEIQTVAHCSDDVMSNINLCGVATDTTCDNMRNKLTDCDVVTSDPSRTIESEILTAIDEEMAGKHQTRETVKQLELEKLDQCQPDGGHKIVEYVKVVKVMKSSETVTSTGGVSTSISRSTSDAGVGIHSPIIDERGMKVENPPSLNFNTGQPGRHSPAVIDSASEISVSDGVGLDTSRDAPTLGVMATETSDRCSVTDGTVEQTNSKSLDSGRRDPLQAKSHPAVDHRLTERAGVSDGPVTATSTIVASSSQLSTVQVCHSSLSLTCQSIPVDTKASISQAMVTSRSSLPTRHLKGFPLGYASSRPRLHTPVRTPFHPVQVTYGSAVPQVASSLQVPLSGYRYPASMAGQQMLVNQAGQLLTAGQLPLMSPSYMHPSLPVSQAQFSFSRNPSPLTGVQIAATQPLMHIPMNQSYQAAIRQQQSLIRPQYIPVASHMAPSALSGLPVSAARSTVTPQYVIVNPQLPVGYPQMMYSPQMVSQSQLLGSPLQLSASGLGVQMLPRMSSVNPLGMPVILTQPQQPRMRYS